MVPIFRSWLEYSPPSTDFLHDVMLVCIPFVSCTSMLSHLVHLISCCLGGKGTTNLFRMAVVHACKIPEDRKDTSKILGCQIMDAKMLSTTRIFWNYQKFYQRENCCTFCF